MRELGLMSTAALVQLWDEFTNLQARERAWWELAERLMEEHLVSVEDVATVYGIHPQTARKRLAALHYRRLRELHRVNRPTIRS